MHGRSPWQKLGRTLYSALCLDARTIALDRGVDEFSHLGKFDDLVELFVDLLARHAEDGGIEVDGFAPGEVGHEAGADFDQGGNAAIDLDRAAGGGADPGSAS